MSAFCSKVLELYVTVAAVVLVEVCLPMSDKAEFVVHALHVENDAALVALLLFGDDLGTFSPVFVVQKLLEK